MKVIAHDRVRQYGAGKNLSQLGNSALNPKFAVFKRLLQIAIPAAEPRSAHAAGKAVYRIRLLALGCSYATLFPRRVIPAVSLVGSGFAASVCGVGL